MPVTTNYLGFGAWTPVGGATDHAEFTGGASTAAAPATCSGLVESIVCTVLTIALQTPMNRFQNEPFAELIGTRTWKSRIQNKR